MCQKKVCVCVCVCVCVVLVNALVRCQRRSLRHERNVILGCRGEVAMVKLC